MPDIIAALNEAIEHIRDLERQLAEKQADTPKKQEPDRWTYKLEYRSLTGAVTHIDVPLIDDDDEPRLDRAAIAREWLTPERKAEIAHQWQLEQIAKITDNRGVSFGPNTELRGER